MNFEYSEEQRAIKDSVERLCARFDDQYWLDIDNEGRFPEEFYQAMANEGWLGICTPEQYGGAGLGIMEAAIMMRTVAESGAGMTGASAIDRKSTRLNSSHVAISYAVFCLTKRKIEISSFIS